MRLADTTRVTGRGWRLLPFLLALFIAISQAQTQAQTAPTAIARGNELLRASQPEQALEQFQQALSQNPRDVEALRGIGKAQQWLGHWPEAVAAFQQVVNQDATDKESWMALGHVYGYQGNRPASYAAFEKALALDPTSLEIERAYAEVLSWDPARRPESIRRYREILGTHPESVEAQIGLAQALAWSGATRESETIYKRVLNTDAANIPALVGLAEAARWNMELGRSRAYLEQARQAAPLDARILAGWSELELVSGHYGLAQTYSNELASGDPQAAARLNQEIHNARRAYFEAGYGLRRDRNISEPNRLDFNSYSAVLSLPATRLGHIQLFSDLALYRGEPQVRNASLYGLRWESASLYRVQTAVEAFAQTSPSRPANGGGSLAVDIQAADWARIGFGLDRKLVQDSLQSARGSEANGVLVGQVYSNLASARTSFRIIPAGMDLYANLGGGFYQGHGLDRNWMGQLDGGVGNRLHASQPYVRIGYGITAFRFMQDQSFLPGPDVPVNRAGGYFSPRWFVNNFGILGMSGKFAGTGEWTLEGSLGAQQVRDRFSDLNKPKLSSTAHGALSVPLGPHLQIGVAYDFLNVGNSFERNLASASLRLYF